MHCPTCNTKNPTTAKFCNICGNKLELQGKTCPNEKCNCSDLPNHAVYCRECGTKLEKDIVVEQSVYVSPSFSFSYDETRWEKFFYWFKMNVWWEFQNNGWKYLIAYSIIIGLGIVLIANSPSLSKIVIPCGLSLILFIHQIID